MKKKHLAVNTLQASTARVWPIFLLPVLVCFCISFIWPFIQGIYLSFCNFRLISDAEFVGFSNYAKVFTDPSFGYSFGFTALYAGVSIVLINVFAFLIAYALTQNIKGSNLFRTVFFMPNLIGGIVLGYIWSMIFDGILRNFNTSILLDTTYGFWGLIILMCWQQIGYMMIIYIAGLQNVPDDLIEAAKIDGANDWQILWKVKIPMMMPSITICVFLTLTNSLKLFDQNLALTNGDPNHMTDMLALNIYNTFYARAGAQWKGIGQAKSVIFSIVVILIGFWQLKSTRSKEVQA